MNAGKIKEAKVVVSKSNPERVDRSNEFIVLDGLTLTLVTAAAWLLMYAYESGFAGARNIPREFIDITAARLFSTAAVSWLVAWVVGQILFVLWASKSERHYVMVTMRLTLATIITFAVIAFTFGTYYRAYLILFGVFAVVFLAEYLPPYISQRGKKMPYWLKYETHRATLERVSTAEQSINKEFVRLLGSGFGTLAGAYAVALLVAPIAGRVHAEQQTDFYVLSTSPEQIVLRVYGSTMIAAPFDRTARTYEPSFSVYQIHGNDFTIREESIGAIKIAMKEAKK